MAERVKVKIKKTGEVEVKVEGHKGGGCSLITKDLERALGDTTSDKKTSEYYEQKATTGAGVNQSA